MKKSRIIIPALAMIAFSVAASITGTVAWFTANRTATVNAGTYAVVKTTSDLKCLVSAGIGTTASDDGASSHVIAVGGKLTDGSVDHINGQIITPDLTGTKVSKKTAVASVTENDMKRGTTNDSKNIYTAVTWNMTFTLNFGAANGDIGLYLNIATSKFEAQGSAPAAGNLDTSKGFRMAFIPKGTNAANGKARVFADLQESAKCKYVPSSTEVGAALPAGTAYGTSDLVDSSMSTALVEAGYTETASNSMPNYLGKFAYVANSSVTLEYTVVCWFEGTDENIVNDDATHTVTFRDVEATLEFSAINFATGS